MRHALQAEALRLRSRRLTLVALLLLLGLIALFQLEVNSQIAPPSAAEQAQNQAGYEQDVQDWEANHTAWEADCTASGGTADECVVPRPDPSDWSLAPVTFLDAVPTAVSFSVYLAGLVLFVALASYVAAESTTGSLANWLTFVPDRRLVLASKLVVAAVFSLLVGVAATGLTVAASSVLALVHQQPLTGLDQVVAMAGRGVAVVVILGVLGFCVGLLTGSTGASIGVLLGGLVATYARLILSVTSRWAERLAAWSPEVNLSAILHAGTTYPVSTGTGATSEEPGTYLEKSLSLAHGLGYWAVLLAALIAVTWLVFRRRDVS
jgi:ABC-2 type transport system permease protein